LLNTTHMQIKWNGLSCFTIKTKLSTIITDPFDEEKTGLKLPNDEANLVTVSHDHSGHNNVAGIKGDFMLLDWPGEYDIKDVSVTGLQTFHNAKEEEDKGTNTVFNLHTEEMFICHLGDIGHVLTTDHVDELGQVDILMIPVGGGNCISVKKAKEIIEKLDPSIVIPMHYKQNKLKRDNLETLATFFSEIGIPIPEAVEELKVTKKDLQEEDIKYVVFQE